MIIFFKNLLFLIPQLIDHSNEYFFKGACANWGVFDMQPYICLFFHGKYRYLEIYFNLFLINSLLKKK